jgi:hypothetical protein
MQSSEGRFRGDRITDWQFASKERHCCEPAGRDQIVSMRRRPEVLPSSVQHTQESDLFSKALRIACEFEKCFGVGVKQQSIHSRWVAKRERREFLG